jgi:hypothetical protein
MSGDEKHLELAVELSRDALKALLLVNAGAASALIALTDKSSGGKDYSVPIILFGCGAVATLLAYFFGYFSQLNYGNHRFAQRSKSYFWHRVFQALAIVACIISLGFAIFGMANGYHIASGKWFW